MLNFALGKRDQKTCNAFVEGLPLATAPQPFQITTDGFAPYKAAIPDTLGDRCDYAMLIKVYRATPEGERTYSPSEVVDTQVVPVWGVPDPRRICTSYVERQNLTMRMQMRRLSASRTDSRKNGRITGPPPSACISSTIISVGFIAPCA